MFERNRVDHILKNTKGKLPRYVHTSQNLADVATRPFRVGDKDRWNLWVKGPKYLRQLDDSEWTTEVDPPVEEFPDVLAPFNSIMKVSPSDNDSPFLQHILDRTNKLTKVIHVLMSVQRCFSKWKQKVFQTDLDPTTDVEPVRIAQLMLICTTQGDNFSPVLKLIRSGLTFQGAVETIPKNRRESWMTSVQKFVPFLDPDGILRIGGRLDYGKHFTDQLKHPALLPRRHKVTELFIVDKHERLAHRSAETVLAALSNDEGIKPIGGIQTVRSYLSNCFTCELLRKSRGEQLMAPLPEYRITPRQAVFTSTSLDYAGPFEVKRGRSVEKRWVCVFVCNVTSAIRLE